MNCSPVDLYNDIVNMVIRPQRCRYDETRALGPKLFTLARRIFEREDFEIANGRGMTIQCSLFQPTDSQRPAKKMPCVVYCHGNCVSADTAVTLRSGLSRRIDSLHGKDMVHAWGREAAGEDCDIVTGSVSQVLNQGVRDCIRLELEDGRHIVVTPDHEILVVPLNSTIQIGDAVWRQAKDLYHGDRVICSTIEGVSDDLCAEMEVTSMFSLLNWSLQRDRDTILSFSRLCGAFAAQERSDAFHVRDAIDADQLLHDIETVTGFNSNCISYCTHGAKIEFPHMLAEMLQHAGCHRQNSTGIIPTFLLDPNCPASVMREFIASWWGTRCERSLLKDAQFDNLSTLSSICRVDYDLHDSHSGENLNRIAKRLNEHFFDGKTVIRTETSYFFSIPGTGVEQRFQQKEAAMEAATKCGYTNGVFAQLKLSVGIFDIVPFMEKIGIRYGVDVQRWMTTVKCYMQHLERMSSTASNNKPTNDPKSFKHFIDSVGFDHENKFLSARRSIALRLIHKESCGAYPVFDITVPNHHSFVAAGCVVHNCGSRCDALDAVYTLLPNNINVLALDFTGSGLSDGAYVSLGHYERQDLSSVCEYLWNSGSVSRIGLWGRSMGAATSLMYASTDQRISGMVCDSPFTSLEDVMHDVVHTFQSWIPQFFAQIGISIVRRTILSRAEFDIRDNAPIKFVTNCLVPVLFAHGEGDDFIKMRHSERLYEAYGGEKDIVRFEGDHNSERPDFFYDSVSIFFYNTLIANSELDGSAHPNPQEATEQNRQVSEFGFSDDINVEIDSEPDLEDDGCFSIVNEKNVPTSLHSEKVDLPSRKLITKENDHLSPDQLQDLEEEEQIIYAMIESVKDELHMCSDERRQEHADRLEELLHQAQSFSIVGQPNATSGEESDGGQNEQV